MVQAQHSPWPRVCSLGFVFCHSHDELPLCLLGAELDWTERPSGSPACGGHEEGARLCLAGPEVPRAGGQHRPGRPPLGDWGAGSLDKTLLKPESAGSDHSPGGRGQHQELETRRTQALVSASGWVSSCLVCGGLVRAGGRARRSPGGRGQLPCVCPLTQSRAPWRPSREITEHRGEVGSSRSQLWTQSHTSSQGPKPPGSRPTFLGSGGRGRARQDAPWEVSRPTWEWNVAPRLRSWGRVPWDQEPPGNLAAQAREEESG